MDMHGYTWPVCFHNFLNFFLFAVLGIDPRALHMVGKHSIRYTPRHLFLTLNGIYFYSSTISFDKIKKKEEEMH
jgi:hypothetical protein